MALFTDAESAAQAEPAAAELAASQESNLENLRKEEIINCTCGYMEEDGLMIQVRYTRYEQFH